MPLDYLRGSAGLAGKERSETREVAVSEALEGITKRGVVSGLVHFLRDAGVTAAPRLAVVARPVGIISMRFSLRGVFNYSDFSE
jgi:hypothetical protein